MSIDTSSEVISDTALDTSIDELTPEQELQGVLEGLYSMTRRPLIPIDGISCQSVRDCWEAIDHRIGVSRDELIQSLLQRLPR